jgi:hypothetical protein
MGRKSNAEIIRRGLKGVGGSNKMKNLWYDKVGKPELMYVEEEKIKRYIRDGMEGHGYKISKMRWRVKKNKGEIIIKLYKNEN